MHLPEPHRAVEVTPKNWIWPPNCEFFNVNGRKMFCSDVFRATGTTFIKMVDAKHLADYQAWSYVPGTFLTAAEFAEIDA